MEKGFDGAKQMISKVKEFLDLDKYKTNNESVEENIKELCVAKLCDVLGIKCIYNYKSSFFKAFSEVLGQAICDILSLKLTIAEDNLRLFKYDGINLIDETKKILSKGKNNSILLEESILDIFNFLDKYKEEI